MTGTEPAGSDPGPVRSAGGFSRKAALKVIPYAPRR